MGARVSLWSHLKDAAEYLANQNKPRESDKIDWDEVRKRGKEEDEKELGYVPKVRALQEKITDKLGSDNDVASASLNTILDLVTPKTKDEVQLMGLPVPSPKKIAKIIEKIPGLKKAVRPLEERVEDGLLEGILGPATSKLGNEVGGYKPYPGSKAELRKALEKAGGAQGLKLPVEPANPGSPLKDVPKLSNAEKAAALKAENEAKAAALPGEKISAKEARKVVAKVTEPDLKEKLNRIFEQNNRAGYVNKLNKKLAPLIDGEGPLPTRDGKKAMPWVNTKRPTKKVTLKGTTVQPAEAAAAPEGDDIADVLLGDPINDIASKERPGSFDPESISGDVARLEQSGGDEAALSILEKQDLLDELGQFIKLKKGVTLDDVRAGKFTDGDVSLKPGVDEDALEKFVIEKLGIMDDAVIAKAKADGRLANGKSLLTEEEIMTQPKPRTFLRKGDERAPRALKREVPGKKPQYELDVDGDTAPHRDSRGRRFVLATDEAFPPRDPRRVYREYNDPRTIGPDNPKGRSLGRDRYGDVGDAAAQGRLSDDAPLKFGRDRGESGGYLKKGTDLPPVESILEEPMGRGRYDVEGDARRIEAEDMRNMGLGGDYISPSDPRRDEIASLMSQLGKEPSPLVESPHLTEDLAERWLEELADTPPHKKRLTDDYARPLEGRRLTSAEKRVQRRIESYGEEAAPKNTRRNVKPVEAAAPKPAAAKASVAARDPMQQLPKAEVRLSDAQKKVLNDLAVPQDKTLASHEVRELIGRIHGSGRWAFGNDIRKFWADGGTPRDLLNMKDKSELKNWKPKGAKSIDDVRRSEKVANESPKDKSIAARNDAAKNKSPSSIDEMTEMREKMRLMQEKLDALEAKKKKKK